MIAWLDQIHLLNKLRFASAVLIVCVVTGSGFAYLKIREARQISDNVARQWIPMLDSIRNLRQNTYHSTSALKSQLLFGDDPQLSARYQKERNDSWAEIDKAISRIRGLESSNDYGSRRAQVDAVVDKVNALRGLQAQIEQLALRHEGAATGQAYDLLRGPMADGEQKTIASITAGVKTIQDYTTQQVEVTNKIGDQEVAALWVSTLIGILLGGLLSHLIANRIVSTLMAVVERARSISAGDLTGEPLQVDTGDELAELGKSINEMQHSIARMLCDMNEIAGTVHQASERLSETTRVSFSRTGEQTTQTEMVASAMVQMAASISEVSRNAQTAVVSARQAAETARMGGTVVEESLTGMHAIAESVRQSATTVERLGQESEKIIHIVQVIEEIAAKTNLLALNASIEAARAGEHGRGFAVVAGEVRRLAESTHNATGEIAQMIEAVRTHTHEAVEAMQAGTSRVESGVETTTRAGQALEQIIEMAGTVDQMIERIATAASEQAAGAEQSSANLEVISRLSADANSAIPDTQRVVNTMEQEVVRLQQHIQRFRLAAKRIC